MSKIGTPISGFIRESKYSTEMEKCLLNPSQDGMPWGGLKSNLTLFQSNFTRLRKPGRMKQTDLPKHLDPAGLARKLFGRISRAVTWKNNRFMQKDYT